VHLLRNNNDFGNGGGCGDEDGEAGAASGAADPGREHGRRVGEAVPGGRVAGRRDRDGGGHARRQQIGLQSPLPLLQLEN